MSNQSDIQQVELSLEQAKKVVALGDAIGRLENNRDFKKVVFDTYFNDEMLRLGGLLSDANMQKPADQQVLLDGLKAIGHLKQFLLARKHFADMARKELVDFQETLDEIRAEESDEENAE
jgi:hypothetical protein